jgi:hypothetical protein
MKVGGEKYLHHKKAALVGPCISLRTEGRDKPSILCGMPRLVKQVRAIPSERHPPAAVQEMGLGDPSQLIAQA